MDYIDLSKYFHNVSELLDHYRGLKSFCDNAVDQVIWHINGIDVPTRLLCHDESKLTTVDIRVHIDKQLEIYEGVCELKKQSRRYEIIKYRYLDMPGSKKNEGIYTPEEIVVHFMKEYKKEYSTRTIEREIAKAKKELKIYFFGVDPIRPTH